MECNMKSHITTRILAVALVFLLMLGTSWAGPISQHRGPVSPDNVVLTTSNSAISAPIRLNSANTFPGVSFAGGNRLATTQNPDGGWGWPLSGVSAFNTISPIGMGLAKAYELTSDAAQRAALLKASQILLAKTNNFSPPDGYLAAELDKVFGGTTHTDFVNNHFYGPLAASNYDRNGAGTLYSTATYVQLIRTNRAGAQRHLAAWDLGMGLVAAKSCGASTAEWVAGIEAEINEIDGTGDYDIIGLAGGLYGLAFAGVDFDPSAGLYASANDLKGLAVFLAGYQIHPGGGFTWHKDNVAVTDQDDQTTAYAILALNQVDRAAYLTDIQDAAHYLFASQLGTNGWGGTEENNEVTGEALWAIDAAMQFNLFVNANTSMAANCVYPNDNWAHVTPPGYPANGDGNDWGYTVDQFVYMYVVPEAGTIFNAADFTLRWDESKLEYADWYTDGSLFAGATMTGPTLFIYGAATPGQLRITCSRTDNMNFTTAAGDFIVRLAFKVKKLGRASAYIAAADFRAYNDLDPLHLPLMVSETTHAGYVKAYLGDVAQPSLDGTTGDGNINGDDFQLWALSYWSGPSPLYKGMTNYKVKYDVGPTPDSNVMSFPVVDGKIDFDDLMVFSVMYGLSGNGTLPKAARITEPVMVSTTCNDGIVSVNLGNVIDLRGMSLVFSGVHGKLLSVDKGALLNSNPNSVVLSREADGKVYVDFAVLGGETALAASGEVIVLRFDGKADVNVSFVEARTGGNGALATRLGDVSLNAKPTEFALAQNYPNPFNPSTMISYSLPASVDVQIAVYDVLGEKIATLVSGVQEAGFHNVQWNGTDNHSLQVTSGVYFITMRAGDFSSMRKMMLLK